MTDTPFLDLGRPDHRRMEAEGVVENIVGSLIGSVRKELKDDAKGKKSKHPPTAKGYAKILLADLKARGWELCEVGK